MFPREFSYKSQIAAKSRSNRHRVAGERIGFQAPTLFSLSVLHCQGQGRFQDVTKVVIPEQIRIRGRATACGRSRIAPRVPAAHMPRGAP